MKKIYFLIALFGLLTTCPVAAQRYGKKPKRLFGASAVLGLNLAQIDGDKSSGFEKPGIYGGLNSSIFLSKRAMINIGMLYAQKGSKIERGESFSSFRHYHKESIRADYIEVPVLLKVLFNKEKMKYYGEAGCSFSRRVRLKIKEFVVDSTEQISFLAPSADYKPVDISLVVGFGFNLSKNISAGMRLTTAFNRFYESNKDYSIPKGDTLEPALLRNYFVTFMAAYQFL